MIVIIPSASDSRQFIRPDLVPCVENDHAATAIIAEIIHNIYVLELSY